MKTIQELIAEFLALHPTDWDTCTKAFCECTTATYMFVDFCRLNSSQEHVRGSEIFIRAGKGNPDPETYKPGVNDDGVECCDWHIICRGRLVLHRLDGPAVRFCPAISVRHSQGTSAGSKSVKENHVNTSTAKVNPR